MFTAHEDVTLETWLERRNDVAGYLTTAGGSHCPRPAWGQYAAGQLTRSGEFDGALLPGPFRVADMHKSLSDSARLALESQADRLRRTAGDPHSARAASMTEAMNDAEAWTAERLGRAVEAQESVDSTPNAVPSSRRLAYRAIAYGQPLASFMSKARSAPLGRRH